MVIFLNDRMVSGTGSTGWRQSRRASKAWLVPALLAKMAAHWPQEEYFVCKMRYLSGMEDDLPKVLRAPDGSSGHSNAGAD
jgi:hypothetical protein